MGITSRPLQLQTWSRWQQKQFNVKLNLTKCWDRIFFVPKTWTNGFVKFSVCCLPAAAMNHRGAKNFCKKSQCPTGLLMKTMWKKPIAKYGSIPTVMRCLGLVDKSQNLKKVPALKLRWPAYFWHAVTDHHKNTNHLHQPFCAAKLRKPSCLRRP